MLYQGLGVDVLPPFHDRPLALPLPQRDPVLDDFALRRVDLERLLERVLRGTVFVGPLQDAPELLQRHELVLDGIAVDGGQAIDQRDPLAHGKPELARVFQETAEVDVRRVEIRLEPDALAQRVDGASPIAHFRERHPVVEIDRMQERIAGVGRYPGLVKIGDLMRLLEAIELSASENRSTIDDCCTRAPTLLPTHPSALSRAPYK